MVWFCEPSAAAPSIGNRPNISVEYNKKIYEMKKADHKTYYRIAIGFLLFLLFYPLYRFMCIYLILFFVKNIRKEKKETLEYSEGLSC